MRLCRVAWKRRASLAAAGMAHAALLAALVLSMRAVRVAIAARVGPALPCPRSAHEFPARRLATHRGLPNEPELAGSGAGGARWAAVRLSPPAARRLEELAAAADTLDPLILEAAGSEAHTHIAEAWPGAALHRPVQPAAGESHGRPGGARQLAEYEYMTNTTELPRLRAIDESCRRLVVVWCAAKQGGDGISVYDTYLKVSILSALDKAPHVVPVLLFDGAADHPLAAWVRAGPALLNMHGPAKCQCGANRVAQRVWTLSQCPCLVCSFRLPANMRLLSQPAAQHA